MTTPVPKGYLNFVSSDGVSGPTILRSQWSYGSPVAGDVLYVLINNTQGSTVPVTGWDPVRFQASAGGFSYQLYKRVASGTTSDNFATTDSIYQAAGIAFPGGVVEDYTSGNWMNTSGPFTITANGGGALTSSDGLLVYMSFSLEWENMDLPVYTAPAGMVPGRSAAVPGPLFPVSANISIQTLSSSANPGSRTGAVSGMVQDTYAAAAMLVFKDNSAPASSALGWGLGI